MTCEELNYRNINNNNNECINNKNKAIYVTIALFASGMHEQRILPHSNGLLSSSLR